MQTSVHLVVDYFQRYSAEAAVAMVKGQASIYLPSSPQNIAQGLQGMIDKGFIAPPQRFFDAGSGDGRVVAIAAALGFEALGIEFSKGAHLKADERITDLCQQDLISAKSARVVRGDFTDDAAFGKTPFESFPVIFHAHNNVELIVSRIIERSPVGTVFLYYTTRGPAPLFDVPASFQFLGGLRLKDTAKGQAAPSLGFLLAYRKN